MPFIASSFEDHVIANLIHDHTELIDPDWDIPDMEVLLQAELDRIIDHDAGQFIEQHGVCERTYFLDDSCPECGAKEATVGRYIRALNHTIKAYHWRRFIPATETLIFACDREGMAL